MVTRMDSVYNYVLCDCVLRKCRYTCGAWALRGLSAVTCVVLTLIWSAVAGY